MKNKVITPGILEALKRWYLEEKLTQERIAEIACVNRSSVNKWLDGEARTIRATNWARLLPKLRKYLPPEESIGDEVGILPESEKLLDEFRRRVQDAVMSSDLDAETNVKVFHIIGSVAVPLKLKRK